MAHTYISLILFFCNCQQLSVIAGHSNLRLMDAIKNYFGWSNLQIILQYLLNAKSQFPRAQMASVGQPTVQIQKILFIIIGDK